MENSSGENVRPNNILRCFLWELEVTTRGSEEFAGLIMDLASPTIPKGIKPEINLVRKGRGMGR